MVFPGKVELVPPVTNNFPPANSVAVCNSRPILSEPLPAGEDVAGTSRQLRPELATALHVGEGDDLDLRCRSPVAHAATPSRALPRLAVRAAIRATTIASQQPTRATAPVTAITPESSAAALPRATRA